MSLVNEIYSEVEVFRGLLTAMLINWPDLRPRLEPGLARVDAVLNNPTDQTIVYLVEDMIEMDEYFSDIKSMLDKEADKHMIMSIDKTQELMGRLLGPDDRVNLH